VIDVSMDDDRIVIRLVGHVDPVGLDALRSLLEGARVTGAVAVVDVTAIDDGDLAVVNAITGDPSRQPGRSGHASREARMTPTLGEVAAAERPASDSQ